MPESGGPTTQSGTYFQNTVAAWFMAQMLHDATYRQSDNRVIRVRCEAPEEVDDVVVTFERGVHYVQVKEALSTSEAAWTGLWRHFWKQFDRIDPDCDRLVLWGGQHTDLFRGLQEMAKRAQSVPSGPLPHRVAEFVGRLTKKQLGWLDDITAILCKYEVEITSGCEPVEVTRSAVFELLGRVDVVVKGNAGEIEEQAISTFMSGVPNALMIFAALRDLAAEKARTRGAWDDESLRAVVVERGLGPDAQGLIGAIVSETEAESEALVQELKTHKRNLGTLCQQAAIYGAGVVPLHLLNQIEHEEEAIRDIERRLGK